MLKITVYGKEGCCLCTKATDMVTALSVDYPIELEYIDITGDEKLFNLYRYEIPVVALAGDIKFKGKVARLWLEREIRQALTR
ncbi:MAG: glutaredoxin family protein [Peptococcaceae bacterium]|nr:glutaredoxin family protein [Peptococcaceae bacterium]